MDQMAHEATSHHPKFQSAWNEQPQIFLLYYELLNTVKFQELLPKMLNRTWYGKN